MMQISIAVLWCDVSYKWCKCKRLTGYFNQILFTVSFFKQLHDFIHVAFLSMNLAVRFMVENGVERYNK